VLEIVNIKISDSPRINAKEPVVMLLGQYPHPNCIEAELLIESHSRTKYNSEERLARHLSSSVRCPF